MCQWLGPASLIKRAGSGKLLPGYQAFLLGCPRGTARCPPRALKIPAAGGAGGCGS